VSRRRVGVDVGGTKCLAVALDDDGDVVGEARVETPNDPDELISSILEVAHAVGAQDGIGVGVPGLVTREGVLIAAPNVTSVRMLPLRDRLRAASGWDVRIDNDNTVACLAEWKRGAGRGFDDVLLVGLGTGIGGGQVVGGALQRGVNGFAGEFGHMIVSAGGVECPCGQRGCWERYASGSGLAHHAQTAAIDGHLAAVLAEAGDVAAIRGEHITGAALAGDRDALDVVDTFGWWVAVGLVSLANIFDPAAVVLSGGLSAHPDLFLPPILRSFEAQLFASGARPRPQVVFAELGPLAGAVGAALLLDT
jgi:glucokinase